MCRPNSLCKSTTFQQTDRLSSYKTIYSTTFHKIWIIHPIYASITHTRNTMFCIKKRASANRWISKALLACIYTYKSIRRTISMTNKNKAGKIGRVPTAVYNTSICMYTLRAGARASRKRHRQPGNVCARKNPRIIMKIRARFCALSGGFCRIPIIHPN